MGSSSRHSPSGREGRADDEPGAELTKARPPSAVIPRSPPIRAARIERSMKASSVSPGPVRANQRGTQLRVRTGAGEFLAPGRALSCKFLVGKQQLVWKVHGC